MFNLKGKYKPTGDQPKAIDELTKYINNGHKYQTLWGVTGSGKTFTMANIINQIQKPTLVIAHNKTLAAQLAGEFREFFPDNAVHYFVSYYDYYQPEAYVQKTDTYIEKEATINEEIDRLRHAATVSLLTRKDVIIVASVSCIYGIGDISAYMGSTFDMEVGKTYEMEEILKQLVGMQFKRASSDFKPGTFHVMGDVLEIFPSSEETIYTIEFWGDEVTSITRRNYLTGEIYENLHNITIFPAKHTVTTKERIAEIVPEIKKELDERLAFFNANGDLLKAERLKSKVEYDLEMMSEVGYVNGIENYSRYLDGRGDGLAPATLIDYFGDDFLTFIDESHMSIPQIGGMYAGDRARKTNLVENGFRLPSAMDNRPLRFEEFEAKLGQVMAVSATPGKYEIAQSVDTKDIEKFFEFDPETDGEWISSEENRIVQQVIRPTGLLDPQIELMPMEYMVDDIMKNISEVLDNNERMLITTITKRSSEELNDYLLENGIKTRYLHSEIETLERLEILKDLRTGKIDVIVGVNLLREGLDLPEVSRIAIIDADKQGFLRSESALIQIIGRAARNSNGKVIMYSEKYKSRLKDLDSTKSTMKFALGELYKFDEGKWINPEGLIISNAMRKAIDLTYYRRGVQNKYNEENNITPTTVISEIKESGMNNKKRDYSQIDFQSIEKEIKKLEFEMGVASSNMDYEKARDLRDTIIELRKAKKK
ncbi:MAG: excinuclease ABC subunit UvrB [Candidatus Gracilibacteria bacterium]|nr:excinuclease ABC subunit UvrB [Candidatus Gracilibacteria bacterium]